MGNDVADRGGGMAIEDIRGSGECFDPKGRGHMCVEEKCPNVVINGANHELSFAILWGCVRT